MQEDVTQTVALIVLCIAGGCYVGIMCALWGRKKGL